MSIDFLKRLTLSALTSMVMFTPAYLYADVHFAPRPSASKYVSSRATPECDRLKQAYGAPIIALKQQACDTLSTEQRAIEANAYNYTKNLCYAFKVKKDLIAPDQVDEDQLNESNKAWLEIVDAGIFATLDKNKQLRSTFSKDSFLLKRKQYVAKEVDGVEQKINIYDESTFTIEEKIIGINFENSYGSNFTHFLTNAPGYYYALESCLGGEFDNTQLSEKYKLFNEFTRTIYVADIVRGGGLVETLEFVLGVKIFNGLARLNRFVGNPVGKVFGILKSKFISITTLGAIPVLLRSSQMDPDPLDEDALSAGQQDGLNTAITELFSNKPSLSELHVSQLRDMVRSYQLQQEMDLILNSIINPWLMSAESGSSRAELPAAPKEIHQPESQLVFKAAKDCESLPGDDSLMCMSQLSSVTIEIAITNSLNWQNIAVSQMEHLRLLYKVLKIANDEADATYSKGLEASIAIIEDFAESAKGQ